MSLKIWFQVSGVRCQKTEVRSRNAECGVGKWEGRFWNGESGMGNGECGGRNLSLIKLATDAHRRTRIFYKRLPCLSLCVSVANYIKKWECGGQKSGIRKQKTDARKLRSKGRNGPWGDAGPSLGGELGPAIFNLLNESSLTA